MRCGMSIGVLIKVDDGAELSDHVCPMTFTQFCFFAHYAQIKVRSAQIQNVRHDVAHVHGNVSFGV